VRAAVHVLPNLGRYDEHLPQDYKGLGDVPFTAEAAVDVGVRLWKGLEATGMVAGDALGRGHGGSYATAGVRLRGALGQTGLQYGFGADIVAATRDYMESYYGVSSKQAAETGLEAYDAGAGVEAARARLTLALPLGPRLTVATEVTVRSLLGSARRSPVVRATEQGATQLVVTYNL
jgi:outer membrane scaffolding protein for murein synthesis (MipA/OmpV family)